MKYIKKFESEELKNSLQQLSYKMGRFKSLVKKDIREKTPKEIYEDYFLEFKEVEKFYIEIKNRNYGLCEIDLYNIIDKSTVENEFYRYSNKLKSIKERLEHSFGFTCHYTIKLNGKVQAIQRGYNRQDDEYKFLGIGDKGWGYDGNRNHYNSTTSGWASNSTDKILPEDKVSIIIAFIIV